MPALCPAPKGDQLVPKSRDIHEGEAAVLREALVSQLFPTMKSLAEAHDMSPCQALTLMLQAMQAIHAGLHAAERTAPAHDPVPSMNDPRWS